MITIGLFKLEGEKQTNSAPSMMGCKTPLTTAIKKPGIKEGLCYKLAIL
jgi:hypothetical protein